MDELNNSYEPQNENSENISEVQNEIGAESGSYNSYDNMSGSYESYAQDKINSQPQYNAPPVSNEADKRANTVKILGIVSIAVSVIIGFCCCTFAGPIVGIVGIVMGAMIKQEELSDAGRENLKLGRILCIIGIGIGVLFMIINFIFSAVGVSSETAEMIEELLSEMEII